MTLTIVLRYWNCCRTAESSASIVSKNLTFGFEDPNPASEWLWISFTIIWIYQMAAIFGVEGRLFRQQIRSMWPPLLLRPGVVLLEAIKPTSKTSRSLGKTELSGPLADQVEWLSKDMDKIPLSKLEKKSGISVSLLIDRLQRVATLHDLGIVHGGIRNDGFRLPDDLQGPFTTFHPHKRCIDLYFLRLRQGSLSNDRYFIRRCDG